MTRPTTTTTKTKDRAAEYEEKKTREFEQNAAPPIPVRGVLCNIITDCDSSYRAACKNIRGDA